MFTRKDDDTHRMCSANKSKVSIVKYPEHEEGKGSKGKESSRGKRGKHQHRRKSSKIGNRKVVLEENGKVLHNKDVRNMEK